MTGTWLIVEASLPNLQSHEGRQETIRNFVKPVIDMFQSNLNTFHFFFEPKGLLLRLRSEERFVNDTLKPYIEERLAALNMPNRSVRVEAGYSEQQDYGQGWEVALKIFEIGSRSAILQTDRTQLGIQFNEGKFGHLLLNQWGYSIEEEAHFHFRALIERLVVIFSGADFEMVERKLPQVLKETQTTFLQQIVDAVRLNMKESTQTISLRRNQSTLS